MKNQNTSIFNNIFMKIDSLIEQTDIRVLTIWPPIIGFGVLVLGGFLMNLVTNGHPYRPVTDFLVELMLLFICFSGYAEIHKKEMVGPFGRIYKGKLAIVSGWILILGPVVFGGAILVLELISSLR